MVVQSAAGLLALLEEDDASLQAYALDRINSLVDSFWAEIADYVVQIETLSEDQAFAGRQLASLVASKVYYHLGNLDEALNFALGAGKLFDVELAGSDVPVQERLFVDTIVAKAIDVYTAASAESEASVDERLRSIIERMFDRCERDGEFKQALGIALVSHRLDVVNRLFDSTKDVSLLEWILQIVIREGVLGGSSRAYRQDVLHLLIKLFSSLDSPDYFAITQCFVYLNDPSLASGLLSSLLSLPMPPPGSSAQVPLASTSSSTSDEDKVLIAYQVAFDLAETATQEFLKEVRNSLNANEPQAEPAGEAGESVAGAEKATSSTNEHRDRVVAILTGEESIKLYLEFLYRNNKSDMLILKKTKDSLEARNSIYHSAVTFMNAFAHAGTTSDQFLRDNLQWLGRASNWSKFSATGALGVIHKGNLAHGMPILQPYLPGNQGSHPSVYSEGGSLYALGLIYANHATDEVLMFLRNAMKDESAGEVVQHGAALGLGAAAMATGSEDIYSDLREVLYSDSAIAGEAAGYAMGLVMLGTASQRAIDEMLQYAHETQHEKIIRGLAIGLSFLMYGKEEEADTLIETLLRDQDAIVRYGGIHTIAMAYAGTGNNKSIRQLLHVAVSDVNDDVRRAAVTSLGFVLFRNPTQVPRIVQLLSESYNPHVRYGAALALGISCAGTGLSDAIDLLEPLTKDTADFVRQGACIALAMVMIEQNDTLNPRSGVVRKIFEKMIADKHEDAMAKFGAALAQGIIDAGGRNVTITMQNKSGSPNMPAIAGMVLFTQFWYWFPLAHNLSLAFTPTAIIGINKDLRIPKFDFVSNAPPRMFAYQAESKPPEEKQVEKVATAVLSTTAKASQRAKTKAKEQAAADGMETDKPAGEDEEMKVDGEGEVEAEEGKEREAETPSKKKKEPEPASERLPNLSRVTPVQLGKISFPNDGRWTPVRPVVVARAPAQVSVDIRSRAAAAAASKKTTVANSLLSTAPSLGAGGGILLMRDSQPEQEAGFIEMETSKGLENLQPVDAGNAIEAEPSAGAGGSDDDEALRTGPIAEPPPPFEWTDWGN